MKLKNLLILIAICLGLGAYVHFGIEKANEEKEKATEQESKIAKGDLTQLEKVSFQSGEKKLLMEKEGKLWKLKSPIVDIAAQSKIDNLVSALQRFKQSKVIIKKEEIASKKDSLKQYNLDPAKTRLEYKTSDLANPVVLFLGGNNPASNGVYTQVGENGEVVLGSMDLDYLSTQGVDDFREMRLVTVEPADYVEVEIQQKNKKTKFKKDDNGRWAMTSPYQLPIDQDLVKSEIQKISYIRANSFYHGFPDALKNPDAKIIVGFKENVQDARSNEADKRPHGTEIILGRFQKKAAKTDPKTKQVEAAQYEYFAKSDKTDVATIAQFHYDNFGKAPEDFIRKNFDSVELAAIKKVSIKQAGSPEVVILKENDKYTVQSQGQSKPGDGAKVDSALRALRNLKAMKFLETFKQAPTSSSMTVEIENLNQKKLTFVFNFKKDAGELWYSEEPYKMKYLLEKEALKLKDFELASLVGSQPVPKAIDPNEKKLVEPQKQSTTK